MHVRTRARQMVLQILYQIDVGHSDPEPVLEVFWTQYPSTDKATRAFVELLVHGTLDHLPTIDLAIQEASQHWSLERMPVVDRCILRSATYELLYLLDIESPVTINEAIELAKTFSTEESSAFVNAVLDQLKDRGPELVSLAEMRTSEVLEEESSPTAISSREVS